MVFGPILDVWRKRRGAGEAPMAQDGANRQHDMLAESAEDALYGIDPLRILISPLAGDAQLPGAGELVQIGKCHLRKMDAEPAV